MTDLRTKPTNKAELIEATGASWEAFITFTDNLAPEQWTEPTDPAGWTVKDHVAHVTAWDAAVVELFRHHTPQQRTLGVSDAAWTAGGFDAMNEEIRQQTIGDAVEVIQARRDRTWTEVLAIVDGYSEADLAKPASATGLTGRDTTLLDFFLDEFPGHYDEHRRYIQVIVTGGDA
jgi:hypothetical protein